MASGSVVIACRASLARSHCLFIILFINTETDLEVFDTFVCDFLYRWVELLQTVLFALLTRRLFVAMPLAFYSSIVWFLLCKSSVAVGSWCVAVLLSSHWQCNLSRKFVLSQGDIVRFVDVRWNALFSICCRLLTSDMLWKKQRTTQHSHWQVLPIR